MERKGKPIPEFVQPFGGQPKKESKWRAEGVGKELRTVESAASALKRR